MPVPWHPLPPSLKTLQLYRHLLREASYLPPAFRKTIDSTIRKRFHNNRSDGPHTKKRLVKAMSSLRKLRAANSGDKDAMQSLVLKGFGRAGNRRRDLMTQLVKPQGPADSQALESLLDQTSAPSTADQAPAAASETPDEGASVDDKSSRKSKNLFVEQWDVDKLLQIIRSQKQHQSITKHSTSWPGNSVKSTDPNQEVPKTNAWGKPPAACLVRAKLANWWRRNADKIMPPLGKGEWELLQHLSKGAQDAGEWAVPARRPCAHAPVEESASEAGIPDGRWDWEGLAVVPTARFEHPKTRLRHRRTGLHDSGPYGGNWGRSDLSSRWFRRVYNRTWQVTPKMEQDPNTLRYSFQWGHPTPNLPSATSTQLQIFDGVDARGNLVGKKSGASASTRSA
ncbi:hypothetical protein E4U42_002371 [Claviceps africana]|uniref:LYR motif-containing protein Cup1-like N-terminal domain-containing protein n=1 Tax=Claviceps africana TaxID=83212 RepID=A0A8K0J8E5_9HYPO|nr:hypothetical protein E4U42_002371 [Claviceps africana]